MGKKEKNSASSTPSGEDDTNVSGFDRIVKEDYIEMVVILLLPIYSTHYKVS
jgi:hypothetical protein